MSVDILQQDIQRLLELFAKNMYKAKDSDLVSFSVDIFFSERQKMVQLFFFFYNGRFSRLTCGFITVLVYCLFCLEMSFTSGKNIYLWKIEGFSAFRDFVSYL